MKRISYNPYGYWANDAETCRGYFQRAVDTLLQNAGSGAGQQPKPTIIKKEPDSWLQPHFEILCNGWSFDIFLMGEGVAARAMVYKKLGGRIYNQRGTVGGPPLLLKPVVLDFCRAPVNIGPPSYGLDSHFEGK
jgi:hypothetical protein